MPDWSNGSDWIRIDPHLHAPGTLRSNQYGDHNSHAVWAEYLRRLRAAVPQPSILGITDYFIPRGYRLFRTYVRQSDLPGLRLVFPNIELRLNIKTDRGQAINVHLLVAPNDPKHLEIIEGKLQSLVFSYDGEKFRCTADDLRRLGRAHAKRADLDDEGALRHGASQFLVEFSNFAELRNDSWVSRHVLFAVAAGSDGLGGISRDSAFHAHREELAAISDIIFSGQQADRSFWLGEHPDFQERGYSPKPCLHGCDAHRLEDVLLPKEGRICWIRAQPTFDGLRQTLVEPNRRVFIGAERPSAPRASDVIRRIRFEHAAWIDQSEIELNDGLVTIIGARGSGKTALAELIALAADARDPEPGPASFLLRAAEHLGDLRVTLEWGDGTTQGASFKDRVRHEPRVRYLSQQFVERLSSRTEHAAETDARSWDWPDDQDGTEEPRRDELLDEIERVVFDAIPDEDRLLCSDFAELRDVALRHPIAARQEHQETIRTCTSTIGEEQVRARSAASLKARLDELVRECEATEKDLRGIPVRAADVLVKAHDEAVSKLKRLQNAVAAATLKAQQLDEVASDVRRQSSAADQAHANLRARFGDLLQPEVWDALKLRPAPQAIDLLEQHARAARDLAARLRQRGLDDEGPTTGIANLTAGVETAKKALGEDAAHAKRRTELERKLAAAKQASEVQRKALAHANAAPDRIKGMQAARYAAYEGVFQSLQHETDILESLYASLRARLAADARLSSLSFFVYRHVDLPVWTARGNALFDLRRPPFQGHEALADYARQFLLSAWQSGTPSEVREAMQAFSARFGTDALASLARGVAPLDLGQWLFSTEHITVRYGIKYEGIELANLSPGTRGIVLLTLYLAIDQNDDRPLIIDQPEENLDPKSVYASLVPFFRDAARRRQIIMVTHNANLVVNTDSDQVIVAESERTVSTALPKISYSAGGLEDQTIRGLVCRYLEGGADAFRRRGQRYGLVA
jgi:energy-coupling factor transporter ATP-binding protein EcfA2